jgi:hypothetical protein
MTLAIALRFPWGFASNYRNPPGQPPLERAVILATDSRFSYAGRNRHNDLGAKLWKFGENIGAVFAGNDVAGIEDALLRTGDYLAKYQSHNFESIGQCAEQGFKSAKFKGQPNMCLIGVAANQEEVDIIKVSSETSFVPEHHQTNQYIGDERAVRLFESLLAQEISPHGTPDGEFRAPMQFSATGWATAVMGVLDKAIEQGPPTIGGFVQMALVTFSRWNGPRGYDIGSATDIRKITVSPSEVRGVIGLDQRRQGLK